MNKILFSGGSMHLDQSGPHPHLSCLLTLTRMSVASEPTPGQGPPCNSRCQMCPDIKDDFQPLNVLARWDFLLSWARSTSSVPCRCPSGWLWGSAQVSRQWLRHLQDDHPSYRETELQGAESRADSEQSQGRDRNQTFS